MFYIQQTCFVALVVNTIKQQTCYLVTSFFQRCQSLPCDSVCPCW